MNNLRLTPYTFGTMSLGRTVENFDNDIKVARTAMDAGISFHTSQEYGKMGGTFMVLNHAFKEAPGQIPEVIAKIRCDRHELITYDVEDLLRTLNLDKIHCAQLCKDTMEKREIVDDFLNEGPMFEACCKLKERGLVENFIMEVFELFSADALKALQNKLFDTFIFYYNFYEKQAGNQLFSQMQQEDVRLISMRIVHGGLATPEKALAASEKNPARVNPEKIKKIIELYHQTDCRNLVDFSMRFIHSSQNFISCVGGTANCDHLQEYIQAAQNLTPLPEAICAELTKQLYCTQ
jgi:aryl-alcohol dehydrogenase-like predicted oxidoreductase